MNTTADDFADNALELSRLIRRERRVKMRLVSVYWSMCFRLTRFIEKIIPQQAANTGDVSVLYFGCGNAFKDKAINTDLFALHRFVRNRRRPDVYWSGLTCLPALRSKFQGIVCEHVIEHILPDCLPAVFSSFRQALQPDGTLVVSFPYIRKVLAAECTQGFSSPMAAVNSVVYRHGHTYMYDPETVSALLRRVGFSEAYESEFASCELKAYLEPAREVETCYVIAVRGA